MAATTLMTAKDLERMPDDANRYDLIKGVLKKMSPTGGPHLLVSGALITLLNTHLYEHGLGAAGGEGGFIFEVDPDTVLGPDVAVLLSHQLGVAAQSGFVRTVPPLVAEVLSPSERRAAIEEKMQVYFDAGVQIVWEVDPRGAPFGFARWMVATGY